MHPIPLFYRSFCFPPIRISSVPACAAWRSWLRPGTSVLPEEPEPDLHSPSFCSGLSRIHRSGDGDSADQEWKFLSCECLLCVVLLNTNSIDAITKNILPNRIFICNYILNESTIFTTVRNKIII